MKSMLTSGSIQQPFYTIDGIHASVARGGREGGRRGREREREKDSGRTGPSGLAEVKCGSVTVAFLAQFRSAHLTCRECTGRRERREERGRKEEKRERERVGQRRIPTAGLTAPTPWLLLLLSLLPEDNHHHHYRDATGTLQGRHSLISVVSLPLSALSLHQAVRPDLSRPLLRTATSYPKQPQLYRLLQPQSSPLDRQFSRSRPPFQPINTPGGLGKSRAHVALTMCRLLLASAGMTAAWLSI
jgi:hypothetical protein